VENVIELKRSIKKIISTAIFFIKKVISVNTKGKHIVIDMFDCNCKSNILDDKPLLTKRCIDAVEITQNKIIDMQAHQFEPQGISIVIMLAESHLALHTYPEENYVSIDIYSCGLKATPEKVLPFFNALFEPETVKYFEITRGVKRKTKIKEERYQLVITMVQEGEDPEKLVEKGEYVKESKKKTNTKA